MKGLIQKDLYVFKNKATIISIVFLLVFMTLFSIKDGTFSMMANTMVIMAIAANATFTADKMCKWDQYAACTPVSRRKIVLSKYIVAVGIIAIAFIITLAIGLMILSARYSSNLVALADYLSAKGFRGNTIIFSNIGMLFDSLHTSTFIALLLISIEYPLIFKMGIEKSAKIFICISVVMVGIAISMKGLSPNISESTMKIIEIAILILTVLIVYISFVISVKVFKNREL